MRTEVIPPPPNSDNNMNSNYYPKQLYIILPYIIILFSTALKKEKMFPLFPYFLLVHSVLQISV